MADHLRNLAGLIVLSAIALAHLVLCTLSLILHWLRGGRRRTAGDGAAPPAILVTAPFAPGDESGGSKAVLDLVNTIKPRFDASVYVIPKDTTGGLLGRIAQVLLRPLPIPPHCRALMFGNPGLRHAAQRTDIVFFEFLLTAVFLYFGRLDGQRVVIRDHEVLVRKLDMERRQARGLQSAVWLLRTLTCYLVSCAVYARADRIITLTEADKQAVARWFPFYAARVEFIPAPFDAPAMAAGAVPIGTISRDLMMVANFFHSPNRDGLRWFLKECAPHLEPGFTLHLCGLDTALEPSDLQSPYIRLVRHGFVADNQELARLAAVAVAPIVSGGGVRIKNLFLGSMGKALVTTPLGNEGIEFQDGIHAMICNDGADMARRINAAVGDAAYLARLGQAAREHVRTRFNQHAIAGEFVDLFADLWPNMQRA